MKYYRLLFVLFLTLSINLAFGQTDVSLKIHHHLGSGGFRYNQDVPNNLMQNFRFTRLAYYVSEITLVHDGGQETKIDSLWLLVEPTESFGYSLGNLNVQQVEAIKFGIGVDPAHNNLDPNLWPSAHPLAPKAPSMHWGWTAGYRFVAAEGWQDVNNGLEVHALGNQNYYITTINLDLQAQANAIEIPIYANYRAVFDNIDIQGGLINHGDIEEAVSVLRNFNTSVFSASAPQDSLATAIETAALPQIKLFPNPVSQNLFLSGGMESISQYDVLDLTGRVVLNGNEISNVINVSALPSGWYQLKLYTSLNEPTFLPFIVK